MHSFNLKSEEKFDPDGHVVMNLGRREEGYDSVNHAPVKQSEAVPRDGWFGGPTDVTWDQDDNLFVSDGYDFRSSSDPMNHAIFVFDVSGPSSTPPPTASFAASPTSGIAPLSVQFTDTSTGSTSTREVMCVVTASQRGTAASRRPAGCVARPTIAADTPTRMSETM